ncbi:ABC transporter substrate-binding protein [Flavobacterium sp. '19STA2R22 D10 B1']|uniref:ABC transporter substrate-binding protein n=1 Tax=Flavobacterium aerium TaxID=3037261 RepID=UPI00278C6015|nr:ABC transporter substrate-binding protein [Flavobacterium sp. '19STA2R22 D10 B1']
MKHLFLKVFFCLCLISLTGCKKEAETTVAKSSIVNNTIQYAKGLEIYPYAGYSIVKITNPWPNATKQYIYVLQQKNGIVPDSLQQYTTIQVPIQTVVATSTTHIPSLEMLGVEHTLVGFPNTSYISSEKTRKLIDAGKVKEVGNNESLNTEVLIDLAPQLIVGYGIDDNNPALDNLQKSGLKVILNGDWNEQTPLGKAEWLKFFGALYGLEDKANSLFQNIEKEYKDALVLAQKATTKPTVLSGALYKDQWYLPEGNSWAATFLKDANAEYMWANTTGTGSLSLSFETVLDKAQSADFWIGPAQFSSLDEMSKSNPHYSQFKAFKNKNVYSSSIKKGATGGVIYYELSPNRPDIVLKDIIKITHPELLTNYEPFFFQKLE